MSRSELIKSIEKVRKTHLITYITSDRQGMVSARIASDIIPLVANHLRKLDEKLPVDLLIYSAGGDTMVPWRLVTLIREYAKKFSVIIPYKAHSAATMLALGADEIITTDLSELTPIDPSTTNDFNPVVSTNTQEKIPISVEDVMAYFDLAKDKVGVSDPSALIEVFLKLVDSNPGIHPLAIGNVNRTHNLIRVLARQLLNSHVNPMSKNDIDRIINYLTKDLHSHQYLIGREEAKNGIGIKTIKHASPKLSEVIQQLYDSYSEEMELTRQWQPDNELGTSDNTIKSHSIAYIEDAISSDIFEVSIEYSRQVQNMIQNTPQGPVQIPQQHTNARIIKQGWRSIV